jgi:hypothetical protein
LPPRSGHTQPAQDDDDSHYPFQRVFGKRQHGQRTQPRAWQAAGDQQSDTTPIDVAAQP